MKRTPNGTLWRLYKELWISLCSCIENVCSLKIQRTRQQQNITKMMIIQEKRKGVYRIQKRPLKTNKICESYNCGIWRSSIPIAVSDVFFNLQKMEFVIVSRYQTGPSCSKVACDQALRRTEARGWIQFNPQPQSLGPDKSLSIE